MYAISSTNSCCTHLVRNAMVVPAHVEFTFTAHVVKGKITLGKREMKSLRQSRARTYANEEVIRSYPYGHVITSREWENDHMNVKFLKLRIIDQVTIL